MSDSSVFVKTIGQKICEQEIVENAGGKIRELCNRAVAMLERLDFD